MEVLALEHDFGSRLSVRGEVFDKRITHGRQRLENFYYPDAFLPELRADRLQVRSEGGEMFGFDLYVTAAFSERLAGWLSYSASSVKDTLSGYELAPRAWEQQHSGSLGLTWSSPVTVVSAEVFAHSNWPLVSFVEGFVATGQTGEPWRPSNFLGSRDPRGRGYYLSLNLRAEHTFVRQSGAVRVALDVSNATDRRNVCCSEVVFYPKPGGAADSPPDEASEPRHWLPLEPYLSVAWEF